MKLKDACQCLYYFKNWHIDVNSDFGIFPHSNISYGLMKKQNAANNPFFIWTIVDNGAKIN